jgi:hypothetical protein
VLKQLNTDHPRGDQNTFAPTNQSNVMIRTTHIAALITGIWITSSAQGQSNAPAPTPAPNSVQAPPTSRPTDGWRQLPLEAMTKKMTLSPEQLEKIKAIDKEFTAKHEAMSKTGTIEEQRAAAGKLMVERDAAVKKELSGEQKAAFERLSNPTGGRTATSAERIDEKVARPAPAKAADPAAPAAPAQKK